jgi:pilus assembly protein Flp/PilA
MYGKKKREKGQGLVEYALILVLVAIVVIAALMILGPLIGNVFSTINSSLTSFGPGVPTPALP